MRTVAPQIKTVEQPVQFLNRQHDGFVGDVGRSFEMFGLQTFELQAKTVALPIQHFDAVTGFVEEDKKYRIEHGDLDVQLDQRGQAVYGLSKVHGVEVDFFDFCIGAHHEVLAPEKVREHSIEGQLAALKV